MDWFITMTYADDSSERLYYVTREEARYAARYYRTHWAHADNPHNRLVSAQVSHNV